MAWEDDRTVCELLADEEWTDWQVDTMDGILGDICIFDSRTYNFHSFTCCTEHKKVLLDFCNKEIEQLEKGCPKRALEGEKRLRKLVGKLITSKILLIFNNPLQIVF